MPPLCDSGIRSERYTFASGTTPVAATCVTGAIRPIIDTASYGSTPTSPLIIDVPGETVSRFVPSAASCRSSSARLDDEIPTTAIIAAIPIAIPNADNHARSGRVRRPVAPTRSTSPGCIRADRSDFAEGSAGVAGSDRRGGRLRAEALRRESAST